MRWRAKPTWTRTSTMNLHSKNKRLLLRHFVELTRTRWKNENTWNTLKHIILPHVPAPKSQVLSGRLPSLPLESSRSSFRTLDNFRTILIRLNHIDPYCMIKTFLSAQVFVLWHFYLLTSWSSFPTPCQEIKIEHTGLISMHSYSHSVHWHPLWSLTRV